MNHQLKLIAYATLALLNSSLLFAPVDLPDGKGGTVRVATAEDLTATKSEVLTAASATVQTANATAQAAAAAAGRAEAGVREFQAKAERITEVAARNAVSQSELAARNACAEAAAAATNAREAAHAAVDAKISVVREDVRAKAAAAKASSDAAAAASGAAEDSKTKAAASAVIVERTVGEIRTHGATLEKAAKDSVAAAAAAAERAGVATAAADAAARDSAVIESTKGELLKTVKDGIAESNEALRKELEKGRKNAEQERMGRNWAKGAVAAGKEALGDNASEAFQQILKATGKGMWDGAKEVGSFVRDPKQFPEFVRNNGKVLVQIGAGFSAVGVLAFGAKRSIELGADRVRYWWKNPDIVEETDFVPPVLRLLGVQPKDVGSMDEFVATAEFKERLMGWAEELKSLEERSIPRGSCAMFFGEPGTGKTFVAKRIARYAGLSYVIIKGNVIAECENPIETLDRILKWAQKNHILVIIDEADALLSADISTGKDHKILNHFIGVTGNPYDRPNMVIITNHPGRIDSRFTGDGGRVDFAAEFPVPDTAAVAKILENNVSSMAAEYGVPVAVDFMAAARGAAGQCPGRDIEALASKAVIDAARNEQTLTTEGLNTYAEKFVASKDRMRSFVMAASGKKAAAAAKPHAERPHVVEQAAAAA